MNYGIVYVIDKDYIRIIIIRNLQKHARKFKELGELDIKLRDLLIKKLGK